MQNKIIRLNLQSAYNNTRAFTVCCTDKKDNFYFDIILSEYFKCLHLGKFQENHTVEFDTVHSDLKCADG